MTQKPSLATRLAISFFLAIIGVWIPFVHLYLLNTGNLTLSLSVHLPLLGILTAVIIGFSLALQTLIPQPHRNRMSCILLLVGIFLWAEGTLFIGDFGFLKGGFLDWGKNQYILYLELILTGILAFLVLRFKGSLVRHAPAISGLLIFSALANVFPAYQAQKSHTTPTIKHTFNQEDIFQLSPEKNVLIFIIDTFQSDVFAELLAEDSELKTALSGFTYFPDATSAFPKTYTSVPNILTGQTFDNSQPYALFQKEAYLGQSVPRVLKDNGYDARYSAFTWQPYLAHPSVADNLTDALSADGRSWMQQDEFLQLFNLAVFRLTPFFAKPWIYHKNDWRITRSIFPNRESNNPCQLDPEHRVYSRDNNNSDMELLDQMLAFLDTDGSKPAFRVYHFIGSHEPMVIDRDLNVIPRQAMTRATFKAQSQGMVKLLTLVFDHLRKIGAYDNSLIFVVGDHGASEYKAVGIREDGAGELGLDISFSASVGNIEKSLIQGGTPLILAKSMDQSGPLTISPSPVELGDIPQTVFSELSLPASPNGLSLFEPGSSMDRTRYHRHYFFAGWGQDYLLPMTEYKISGFSWNPASWTCTGRNLNQMANSSFAGNLIVLGDGGNISDYTIEGWSPPAPRGRTILSESASIVIPQEQANGASEFEIRLKQKLSPHKPIPMDVFINGEKVEKWVLSKEYPTKMKTSLPQPVSGKGQDIKIRFEPNKDLDGSPIFIEFRLLENE